MTDDTSSYATPEDRAAKALEALALCGGRIALALEDLVQTIPSQHERIQAECLYALLVNAGIEPSVTKSAEWADKLHEYIEAAKRIAALANKEPR